MASSVQRERTVLVLGAGASHNYGYPTGSQLRKQIIALRKSQPSADNMRVHMSDLVRFVDEFRHSQRYSIDSFLARRMEFQQIGKAAIAQVLLACENFELLFDEETPDHWYQLLLDELVRDDWDDLDLRWLAIVSFNYDRSLEQYLQASLERVYGKSNVEVRDKLRELSVVHVYGDLGSLWPDSGGFPYGGGSSYPIESRIQVAAGRLRVIAEGRDDEEHLLRCRDLLNSAERVCFLGFGFDETNLRRIGAPEAFAAVRGPSRAKRVAATAFALTINEKRRAAARVVGASRFDNAVAAGFRDCSCSSLLRQSLIFDSSFNDSIVMPTA